MLSDPRVNMLDGGDCEIAGKRFWDWTSAGAMEELRLSTVGDNLIFEGQRNEQRVLMQFHIQGHRHSVKAVATGLCNNAQA